jgi:hypothetical protein
VHDAYYARALILDNGSAKLALVTFDGGGMKDSEELAKQVASALGITPDHVMLSTTHDHVAPYTPPGRDPNPAVAAYNVQIRRGVIEAATQANAHLQPARVGFGTGKAYVNTNFAFASPTESNAPFHVGNSAEGPSDKTVAVLAVTTPSGDPIAVYSNYAVHAVVMYRTSRGPNGKRLMTSDLPGATAVYVEERLGHGAVAVWSTGASGDQNPLFIGDYNQGQPTEHDEGDGAWGVLDVQARRLGDEIVRVTQHITDTSSQAVLWGASTTLNCPGQQADRPPVAGKVGDLELMASTKTVDGPPVNVPLTLMMINDIAVAGIAADPFTELGQAVKSASLFDRTMVVGGIAGDDAVGFMAPDSAYSTPWEKWIMTNTVPNRLKPGCAEPGLIASFQGLMRQYLPVWQAR